MRRAIDPAVALSSTAGAEVATALSVTCRPAASTSTTPQREPAAPPLDDEGVRSAAEVVVGRFTLKNDVLKNYNFFVLSQF